MTIEHVDIPDGKRHEPKGISGASNGTVYKANGAGSGTWSLLTFSDISDYNLGYAELRVTGNSTAIAVTAAADATLATAGDYTQITGIYDGTPHGVVNGVTQNANNLAVSVTSDYRLDVWAAVESDVVATSVGLKFMINGVVAQTTRFRTLLDTVNGVYNLSGFGVTPLTAGDNISLAIAADKTCNITISDMYVQLTKVGAG